MLFSYESLARQKAAAYVLFHRNAFALPEKPPMNVTGTIDAILNQKSGDIWSVAPDAMVYDAVALMAEKNVGALVVLENGNLVGIISERDYTRKVMLRGKRSRETAVREIMSTELTTVDCKESVDDCLRFMTDKRVRHLPVVDGGKLRGVISIGDLVKHVISVQSATLQQLESYISGGYTELSLLAALSAESSSRLQRPDRFPADDGADRSALEFPAVERCVAGQTLRRAGVDGPFEIRIDQSHVRRGAD